MLFGKTISKIKKISERDLESKFSALINIESKLYCLSVDAIYFRNYGLIFNVLHKIHASTISLL